MEYQQNCNAVLITEATDFQSVVVHIYDNDPPIYTINNEQKDTYILEYIGGCKKTLGCSFFEDCEVKEEYKCIDFNEYMNNKLPNNDKIIIEKFLIENL
ncbi:MAG: hypothetical protein H7836_04605 [Magnetococcus sp. YQC-3]